MALINLKCPQCGKTLEVTGEKVVQVPGRREKTVLKMFKCGHFQAQRFLEVSFSDNPASPADECSYESYVNEKNLALQNIHLTSDALLKLKAEAAKTGERDELWEKAFGYQRDGVKFAEASNYQCLIADEMGLGKTIQALLALRYNIDALTPTLIVVPSSLTFNWAKEIRTWILDKYPLYNEDGSLNMENAKWMPYIHTDGKSPLWPGMKIYIVSQDLVWKDAVLESIKSIDFQCFIGDEIHKFSNTSAKRTKGLLEAIQAIPHRLVLSGTPIKNRFTEYFTALHIVKPDHWPSREVINRYAATDGQRILGLNPRMTATFFQKTSSYVIRRKKADVLKDLPPILRDFRVVEVNDEKNLTSAYNVLVDKLDDLINNQKQKAHVVEILALLQQLRHLTGLMKIKHAIAYLQEFFESTAENGEELGKEVDFKQVQSIIEKLTELAARPGTEAEGEVAMEKLRLMQEKLNSRPKLHKAGEKITIGVHHQNALAFFMNFVQSLGFEPLAMSGKHTPIEKQAIEEKFKEPQNRLLVASILATGEGRNLQFCQNALIVEREWNPANEEQFELRFSRPLKCEKCASLMAKIADGRYKCTECGHEHEQNHVRITYLVAKDTIDEFFHEIVEMKRAIKGQVLDPSWSIENDPNIIYDLARKVTSKRMKYTGR
jgi:SNF2 family DNA or RNA helicase